MGIKKAPCDMVVYKKVKVSKCNYDHSESEFIVEMIIPKGTLFHMVTNKEREPALMNFSHERKCRAEKVFVTAIYYLTDDGDGNFELEKIKSKQIINKFNFDLPEVTYKVGQFVYPDKFSKRHQICANGIHFFFDIEDAEWYE
jgi:hypothetical protein